MSEKAKKLKLIESLKKEAAEFTKKTKQMQKHSEKATADLELSAQVNQNLKQSINQLKGQN